MAGMMALASLGVIRIVLGRAAIMFSMAVICPALSRSVLPEPLITVAPSFLASASAPSFIFTKKGLLSVFVIRPITGAAAKAVDTAATEAAIRPTRIVVL